MKRTAKVASSSPKRDPQLCPADPDTLHRTQDHQQHRCEDTDRGKPGSNPISTVPTPISCPVPSRLPLLILVDEALGSPGMNVGDRGAGLAIVSL